MRRLLLATMILGLLSFAASGCGEPGYDYYGSPGYGYAPYSYGYFGRSYYEPDFRYHHDWEDHHGDGHHDSFFSGGHGGGFGGGHGGGFGGGHGGSFCGGCGHCAGHRCSGHMQEEQRGEH